MYVLKVTLSLYKRKVSHEELTLSPKLMGQGNDY